MDTQERSNPLEFSIPEAVVFVVLWFAVGIIIYLAFYIALPSITVDLFFPYAPRKNQLPQTFAVHIRIDFLLPPLHALFQFGSMLAQL